MYSSVAPAQAYALHQFSYQESYMDKTLEVARPQILGLDQHSKRDFSMFYQNSMMRLESFKGDIANKWDFEDTSN